MIRKKQMLSHTWGLMLLALCATPLYAIDAQTFIHLANSTIHEANGGFIANIDQVIKTQDEMIKLGIEGSRAYIKEHPEHTKFLTLVIDNADNMKRMTLDEIEAQWHEGQFLKSHGFDIHKMEHFGELFSLMDAILHPATAHICFTQYKKTKNADLLTRASAELIEVVEHVSHINERQTQLTHN